MFSSNKHQNVAGNPGGGYSDNTGTHNTNTGANLDPTDHSQGLNSGYNNNTTGNHGHSTVAGAALDPSDHRTGINSGNTGGNHHTTRTGAALDPTDHRTGVNSGNTTGTGYNNHSGTGTGYNDHSTRTGAALDPTDHRTGINSGNNNNSSLTGTGQHHSNDITTNSALGHNIGPGPHHTSGADVPVGADTLHHGHNAGTTGTGSGLTGSHNNNATTGVGATHGAAGAHSTAAPPGVKSKEMVGKVEVAVGKVLHSASLVNKGEIKLEQAQSIRAQGAELSEAERLEHEAQLRRGRADAHGAAAAGHGNSGLTQPGVAGPGGPVGLDGGFAGQTAGHHVM